MFVLAFILFYLFWLVTAMANWVAWHPLSSGEMRSRRAEVRWDEWYICRRWDLNSGFRVLQSDRDATKPLWPVDDDDVWGVSLWWWTKRSWRSVQQTWSLQHCTAIPLDQCCDTIRPLGYRPYNERQEKECWHPSQLWSSVHHGQGTGGQACTTSRRGGLCQENIGGWCTWTTE